MKKRLFLKNALILTGCSLFLSIMAMVLRVYQTAVIGAEGMGLLQLLLSVYYFSTNLAVSGFNLAVTRLVTESMTTRGISVNRILRRCFGLCLCTGVAAGLLLFWGAPFLGGDLLGDKRTVMPLRILAFSLPLLSVSCCCRGYFLAIRNALKPCIGQICEQLCCFGVTALLLPVAIRQGLTTACCAVAFGMAAGELCGNIVIVLFLLRDRRQAPPLHSLSKRNIPLRKILSISVPIALGYDLRSALIAVENVLIPAGLKQCGSSYAQSLAAYGIVKGIALPTIQFPSAFLTAFSLLLIPEVTQSRASGHAEQVRSMAQRVFRICLRFSMFVVGCFWCFGDNLGLTMYSNAEAGRMLRLLCPLVPFMYLDSIVDAMLKGMDEQMYSLKVNLSDSCIRIILMIVLLPRLGIYGYIGAMYISILYNAALSIGRFVLTSRMRIQWIDWLLCPGLAAGSACLGGKIILNATDVSVIQCCGMISLAGLIYLALLALCRWDKRPDPHNTPLAPSACKKTSPRCT